jgi:hypothetical protein
MTQFQLGNLRIANGPWGLLDTQVQPYTTDPAVTTDYNPDTKWSIVKQTNDPCKCFNDLFTNVLAQIKAGQTPYNPFYNNSNSVISELLRAAKIDPVFPTGLNTGSVPGWGYRPKLGTVAAGK